MIIDSHIHVGAWDYEYYFPLRNTAEGLCRVLDGCDIESAIVMPSDRKENTALLKDLIGLKAGRF